MRLRRGQLQFMLQNGRLICYNLKQDFVSERMVAMKSIKDRLYLSTIADDDYEMAARYHLGLEIAEFCTAANMDAELFDCFDSNVRTKMQYADRFTFHAPFAELCPCAIEPMVREVTRKRYLQAIHLAQKYGANRIVVHGGYLPRVYYHQWFIEESVKFWKALLEEVPAETELMLENVLEDDCGLLPKIVKKVGDPRLRLCLDVGHLHVMLPETDVLSWLTAWAPDLAHVHLHNNFGARDEHNPLPEGDIDMEAVLQTLERVAPEATITIENIVCEPSLEWLAEKGYLG